MQGVGEGDRRHGDLLQLGARHVAQLAVEGVVADEEAGMQDGARRPSGIGHAPLEDAGPAQRQEAVDQHLGAAVQAGREGRQLGVGVQRRAEPGDAGRGTRRCACGAG